MRKLIAVCCALFLAAGVGVLWYTQTPTDEMLLSMARERPIRQGVSSAQPLWGSPKLIAEMVKARESEGRETDILLGSSELGYIVQDSAHPTRFFSENNYGFDFMPLGGAGYQSLWATIEVAALDECGALPQKKIALLIGNQWFMNEAGCTPEAFLNSYSSEALQECVDNPKLSENLKDRILDRVSSLGADWQSEVLREPSIIEKLNKVISGAWKEGSRRDELQDSLMANGPYCKQDTSVAKPDWDYALTLAEQEGEKACTNNEYGINDEYFNTYVSDVPWGSYYKGEPFANWSEVEFSDLKLFLEVCKELAIAPLLIIEPVNGVYYDIQPYTKESRAQFYDKLRHVLDEAEVEYLDLSGHDYDKYYLRDVMHLGWKGWVEVDKALYQFYRVDGASETNYARENREAEGVRDGTSEWTTSPGETTAEQDAETAAGEMLEVEGAGTEVMKDEEASS